MKMTSGTKKIHSLYKHRNNYEFPEWQRRKVWNPRKKQLLIDSMLRGWRIPKFTFLKITDEDYEVVDGQQRLTAIWEFLDDTLELSSESRERFGGRRYSELKSKLQDSFDDFSIQFDLIEAKKTEEEEYREYFRRLQEGMQLTSSEKLHALTGGLRDFCNCQSKHRFFFKDSIGIADTRYAHFDIVAKATIVELEGLDVRLRYQEMEKVFQTYHGFKPSAGRAVKVIAALDLLQSSFRRRGLILRSRTVVQSLITLACRLVETGEAQKHGEAFYTFVERFHGEWRRQVQLGTDATDTDYKLFQRSINANAKTGVRVRHEILIRKMFLISPQLAGAFDASILSESGATAQVAALATSIATLVHQLNERYSARHGENLFSTTNRTMAAQVKIRKPVESLEQCGEFLDDLWFWFWEGPGKRLDPQRPSSFVDVNSMRTVFRHDVEHGQPSDVRSKKRKAGVVFEKYSGVHSLEDVHATHLVLFQAAVLAAIESDLRTISV